VGIFICPPAFRRGWGVGQSPTFYGGAGGMLISPARVWDGVPFKCPYLL